MKRISIFDGSAILLVAIAILLPARELRVAPLYQGESADLDSVAEAQAQLLLTPGDGDAMMQLTDTLRRMQLFHDALRVAGDAADGGGPDAWRASLAASWAHAKRVEVKEAELWAQRALDACEKPEAKCPNHERVRMELYHSGLARAIESDIDPRAYPDEFRKETQKSVHRVRPGR